MVKCFSLILAIFALGITPLSHAAKFYRHIPFVLTLTRGDTLAVDYDFSGKTGIHCTSDDPSVHIEFTYKGHQKSAVLPVILQNGHIPTKNNEVLADIEGQFLIITNLNKTNNDFYEVSCGYLEEK